MITSKMTSKAQTTIPQAVRNALNLKPGDEIRLSDRRRSCDPHADRDELV